MSCNKNMAPTKSMTPWSFLASYYSALHETCTSISSIIWLNSPWIKSSQYLFLGSTLFAPLIYSFHKVYCSSNFEFNSFRFPGFCNGVNTDSRATRFRRNEPRISNVYMYPGTSDCVRAFSISILKETWVAACK